MLVDVLAATPRGGTTLELAFSDGAGGCVDVSELVPFTGVFAPLSDPAFFAAVRVDPELGTVVWPNGADLDAQVLHGIAAANPCR